MNEVPRQTHAGHRQWHPNQLSKLQPSSLAEYAVTNSLPVLAISRSDVKQLATDRAIASAEQVFSFRKAGLL
jgi:hypothetical protein